MNVSEELSRPARACLACAIAFFSVRAPAGGHDGWPSAVAESEVALAAASRPGSVSGHAGFIRRIGESGVARWISDGAVSGEVLFADTFDSGVDWGVWNDVTASRVASAADARGGKCVAMEPPPPGKYTTLRLRDDRWVAFDPLRPVAVLWEALAGEDGDPVWLRVDFRDAEGRDLRPSMQLQSIVDPTQPTIFHRNGRLLNPVLPAGAASLRVYFFVGPGRRHGFLDGVRVVDFGAAAEAGLAAEIAVGLDRAVAPADALLAYPDCDVTASYPVMPAGSIVPGEAGGTLRVRECPGERARAGITLWSKRPWHRVKACFTGFVRRGGGGTVPAGCVSAKIVKCHYQGPGAPDDYITRPGAQVLVPELLLNDDSLVVADHAGRRNLVKCSDGARTWYVDASTLRVLGWRTRLPVEAMPVRDAPSLMPFDVPARENRQVVLRIEVPPGTAPGTYDGEAVFLADGVRAAAVPIELEVLPFTLPAADTFYDRNRRYTMGLYVWAAMSADGSASLSANCGSRDQTLAEYRALVDYGITSPAFVWPKEIVLDDTRFRSHLALVREAGFPGGALHLGASGVIRDEKDPVKLAALKARLAEVIATAGDFGFTEVYFYGFDEARGERLLAQRETWKAVHEAGGKIIVSGYAGHFELVGDLLDLCVFADAPWRAKPDMWHANGARLWKYNSPQTGPENPMLYRRNYGLNLWRCGFDGGCTYCDVGGPSAWNDISGLQADAASARPRGFAYRKHSMFYPTADGVVETLALSGLEAAIKDVRMMTKFLALARARRDARAKEWSAGLSFAADDLQTVRNQTIDWILRLSR